MSDQTSPNGRNGNGGHHHRIIYSDKAIAYAFASVMALLLGSMSAWTLMATLDVRERMVRVETVLWPPPPYQVQSRKTQQ